MPATEAPPSIAEGRALRYAIFSSTPTSGPTRAAAGTEGSCHFRTHAVQQLHRLFDYLVGAGEQHQRHVEAEALGRLEIDHHAANASSTITGMLIACSNPFSRRLSIQRLAAVHCMASQDHSACDHRACEPNILEFAISHRVQPRNSRLLGFPTPISHQPAPQGGNHPLGPELPCYALRHSVPARNRSHNHHQPSNFL